MSVTDLLNRLDRPRECGPRQWMAGCPCCKSRQGRPLSVRELEDGRVLLHAFCGCGTDSVLAALGLQFTDLYPETLPRRDGGYQAVRNRIPAGEVLQAVSQEISLAAILLADIVEGRQINEDGWQRLALAAQRVGAAATHVR